MRRRRGPSGRLPYLHEQLAGRVGADALDDLRLAEQRGEPDGGQRLSGGVPGPERPQRLADDHTGTSAGSAANAVSA